MGAIQDLLVQAREAAGLPCNLHEESPIEGESGLGWLRVMLRHDSRFEAVFVPARGNFLVIMAPGGQLVTAYVDARPIWDTAARTWNEHRAEPVAREVLEAMGVPLSKTRGPHGPCGQCGVPTELKDPAGYWRCQPHGGEVGEP
jgi:hypothetical protein